MTYFSGGQKNRRLVIFLILSSFAGLGLGALAGILVKGISAMAAGPRAVFLTLLLFAALAIPGFHRYAAEERRQAVLLAGYGERRSLYRRLLESLFTTWQELYLPGACSKELTLRSFLQEEKAELYTCASPRVISAVDTFLREAEASLALGCRYQKVIPLDLEKNLSRSGRRLIRAMQEDLGEEEDWLTGAGLLQLLALPALKEPAVFETQGLRLYKS